MLRIGPWSRPNTSGSHQPAVRLKASRNPNGSLLNIAGICNEPRNVAGLMPHPDRACEDILGSADGRHVFASMVATLAERQTVAA